MSCVQRLALASVKHRNVFKIAVGDQHRSRGAIGIEWIARRDHGCGCARIECAGQYLLLIFSFSKM